MKKNSKVPLGYKKDSDQPLIISSTSTSVNFDVTLARAGLVDWEVQVVDEAGNPIKGKNILFFDNDSNKPLTSNGKPLEVLSDQNGMIYVDQMRIGNFRAEFKGDNDYQANSVIQPINGSEKDGKVRTQLVLQTQAGKGRITVKAVDDSGNPVGGVSYIIKKDGVKVLKSATDLVTGVGSHILDYGNYTVEYADTNTSTSLAFFVFNVIMTVITLQPTLFASERTLFVAKP